ncbi:MAG: TonB-dependent receptor [Sediminicola sp.]
MISKLLAIGLYIGFCSITVAQETFLLQGSVLNANTHLPIEGANIIGENLFAISSPTGQFTMGKVSEGSHELRISHVGYGTMTFHVEVGPKTEPITLYLNEAITELQAVEVLGKSGDRKAREVPMVSHQVTKEFMDQNRENSLMQTLRKIPGVSTINIGSGQSKPVIRGLGFNRVAVVQHGIKHEAQQWGSDHGLEIDQYGIDHIQVIKGPASLLYGSDAIAGVVDIQPSTVPLQNSFNGEINLLGESNNDLLGISTGIRARKNKWYQIARVTLRNYADYKVPTDKINYENYIFELHENHLRNTAGKEANASLGIGFVDGELKSETVLSNVYAKNGFFANAHGLEVRTSDIDYDGSNRDIDLPFHKVNHFKITNNTTFGIGRHTILMELGYQNNQREEHSEPVPHGYMPRPTDSRERQFNKNTYSLNARDTYILNDHTVKAGLNVEFQQNRIGGWGFLIPEYDRFIAGIFAFDQYQLNPDLHLLAGIRYDHGYIDTKAHYDWYPSTVNNPDGTTSHVHLQRAEDSTLDFGSMSASVGLSYVHRNTTYKINLGKSFRMPLANELASDGVNYHMYRYEKGNMGLDAERSYQLDIDLDHAAGNLSVRLSPFVNIFDNFIYLNPTPDYIETLQVYEYTQSKVFRMGGEIGASLTLFNKLQLDASGEYVRSRQTSGAKKHFTLPFSPPLSGLFSARYQLPDLPFLENPQLTLEYRMTAAQDEIVPPEEKTEGSQVMNMSFLGEFDILKSNGPLAMRLKLNNVFNTRYFDHTSFYRLIDVPEPGRNISISFTIPF